MARTCVIQCNLKTSRLERTAFPLKRAGCSVQAEYAGKGMDILKEFGQNRTIAPDSVQAQVLVEKWHKYITENYFTCTKEILSCLGQMYIGDERFKQNIDQYGEGTAAFMAASIRAYIS